MTKNNRKTRLTKAEKKSRRAKNKALRAKNKALHAEMALFSTTFDSVTGQPVEPKRDKKRKRGKRKRGKISSIWHNNNVRALGINATARGGIKYGNR